MTKSAPAGNGHDSRDGADHISGLSDDLLHHILAGLHSAAAAARTSVLSRRWRRVWERIPDLIFLEDSSPDAVDAALAAHSAPSLDNLAIAVADVRSGGPVPAARVAAWLLFASERAACEAHVMLSSSESPPEAEEELEVPLLENAWLITANLAYNFRLRLPPAGASFAELRVLVLTLAAASGDDLSRVVSTQCPWLCVLELAMLNLAGDLSIRSDTLRALSLLVVGRESLLDVTAPSLESLVVHGCSHRQSRVSAPKLTEVEWDDAYDPDLHCLVGAGRHLHRLAITQWSALPPLLERFDTADELSLHLVIPPFAWTYDIFLQNTSKIPRSKVLTIGLKLMGHAIEPSVLHLLRRCGSMTKLAIELIHFDTPPTSLCTSLFCPCGQTERLRTDNVALDSLQEVEIHFFTGSDDEVNLVKLLFICKKALKKMTINVADELPVTEEMRQKIRGFSHPSTELEIGSSSSHKRNTCPCKDHDWY